MHRMTRGPVVATALATLLLMPAAHPAAAAAKAAKPSDFDGDGHVDLAIGVPGEAVRGTKSNAGVVHVIRGSASGLTEDGDQL